MQHSWVQGGTWRPHGVHRHTYTQRGTRHARTRGGTRCAHMAHTRSAHGTHTGWHTAHTRRGTRCAHMAHTRSAHGTHTQDGTWRAHTAHTRSAHGTHGDGAHPRAAHRPRVWSGCQECLAKPPPWKTAKARLSPAPGPPRACRRVPAAPRVCECRAPCVCGPGVM